MSTIYVAGRFLKEVIAEAMLLCGVAQCHPGGAGSPRDTSGRDNMRTWISISLIVMLAGCSMFSKTSPPDEAVAPERLPDFDALWDYGDPAATEVKFREVLPMAKASGDASYHAQLLTQIARTQGLQMKFDHAHSTLDMVEGMLADDMTVARIRYLLERGRVYNSSTNQEGQSRSSWRHGGWVLLGKRTTTR
jgi:hypothetical protein